MFRHNNVQSCTSTCMLSTCMLRDYGVNGSESIRIHIHTSQRLTNERKTTTTKSFWNQLIFFHLSLTQSYAVEKNRENINSNSFEFYVHLFVRLNCHKICFLYVTHTLMRMNTMKPFTTRLLFDSIDLERIFPYEFFVFFLRLSFGLIVREFLFQFCLHI